MKVIEQKLSQYTTYKIYPFVEQDTQVTPHEDRIDVDIYKDGVHRVMFFIERDTYNSCTLDQLKAATSKIFEIVEQSKMTGKQVMQTGLVTSMCDPVIYKDGQVAAVLAGGSAFLIDRFVRELSEYSEQPLDWHYVGGRAVVKTTGDVKAVQDALQRMLIVQIEAPIFPQTVEAVAAMEQELESEPTPDLSKLPDADELWERMRELQGERCEQCHHSRLDHTSHYCTAGRCRCRGFKDKARRDYREGK
ncbi:MAG TPA: hypothetical protein VEF04_04795 [Blastocatellia bacterium]|nr:hypothetical protein [Blastocatellia bacterium]